MRAGAKWQAVNIGLLLLALSEIESINTRFDYRFRAGDCVLGNFFVLVA